MQSTLERSRERYPYYWPFLAFGLALLIAGVGVVVWQSVQTPERLEAQPTPHRVPGDGVAR